MKNSYLLSKDHKPNFQNNLQFRLINSAKSELGLISKIILNEITTSILEKYPVNLWKGYLDTIKWFQNINSRTKASFIQFDIIDFYPSISENLL